MNDMACILCKKPANRMTKEGYVVCESCYQHKRGRVQQILTIRAMNQQHSDVMLKT